MTAARTPFGRRGLRLLAGLFLAAQLAAATIALLLHAYARLEPLRYTVLFSFLYVNANVFFTPLVFVVARVDPRRPGRGVGAAARLVLLLFCGVGLSLEGVSQAIRLWIKPDYLPFLSLWHLELLVATLGLCVAGACGWILYLRLRAQLTLHEQQLRRLQDDLAQRPVGPVAAEPFLVRHRGGVERIPQSEVLYFAAEDKYVFLCSERGRFFYEATLKELEGRLDASAFRRIHRRFIVTARRVRRLHTGAWGDLQVELDDPAATRLPVGRAFRSAVRDHLGR